MVSHAAVPLSEVTHRQQLTWQDPDLVPASPRPAPLFPGNKGLTVYPASSRLPGHLQLIYMIGQRRFVNLIHAAFSSRGVEATTEPLCITCANRSKPEVRKWRGQCNMHTGR